ncbi:MAG: hypothetical protein IPK08_03110 [Bacteroidetes bacterium]|nr:hypothetical protein [Bacteroidota bacterium]
MFIEEELKKEYELKYPLYLQLGQILEVKINAVLRANEINYDYVQMRVKSFLSFFEKIDRNSKWKNPFNENDDFCGLRIIHLFDDDLEAILTILRDEFEVIEEYNPTEKRPQTEKEFTYRSYHVFLKLKGDLANSNKKIKDLIAEVQIRTICMHTWAAIEHKLNYKQQKSFPPHFRPFINRKFSQMSAVLEIADDFFVSLRNEKRKSIEEYKTGLGKVKTKEKILNEELNIDALQAYLENKFPKFSLENKNEKNKKLRYFLNELLMTNLTLKSIEEGEKSLTQKRLVTKLVNDYPSDKPTQTGMARLILDITNEEFYKMRKAKLTNSKWMKFVDNMRSKLSEL